MKKTLNSADLETLIQITGYQFNAPKLLEGVDNVAIAHGIRNRDKLPVVVKLSNQSLRLEREYHIVQRLFKQPAAKELLCKPLDKVILSNNGLIAFIYEDIYENQLNKCQPYHSAEYLTNVNNGEITQNTESMISIKMFLQFAIQCCDCLELIHKNQIVHGEIKLNAFLWPKDKVVKIWNFGSGSRSVEQSLTSEGWKKIVQRNGATNFLHMLIYMSPEQTGRTIFQPDHRTDLYSLGITLFVTLTHTLPFAHASPMEIVHNVLNKKLPPVHEIRPETPVAISMIIEKLTNKSPDERYTSAYGVREDLKECLRQLDAPDQQMTIAPFPLGQYDIASVFTLPNNGCFGRHQELNLISAIIRRTAYMYSFNNKGGRSSSGGITAAAATIFTPFKLTTEEYSPYNRMHNRSESFNSKNTSSHINTRKRQTEIIAIYGNTGAGKTTLVRNVQQVAREYGYIATAKFDSRQPTPYGCVLRCLSIFLKNILAEPTSEIERFKRMLINQLGKETISQLPTLLVDNVPELSSFLDSSSLNRSTSTHSNVSSTGCECDAEGAEIRLKFHSAFIEIFQVMVNFKFVTLFLEDLHQADEASIELLDSIISARFDFLVILTYRDTEVSSLISKLLMNENSVVSYIKIENLDRAAIMELVRITMHRLEELDIALLTPLVDFIYKRSHGNPFYTCHILTTLEKKGLIYFAWEKARWEYNLKEIDKALLHEMSAESNGDMSIEFLVHRLKELPRDGRNFLKWASFIGNSFKYETIRNLMMENEDVDEDEAESPQLNSSEESDSEEEIGSSKYGNADKHAETKKVNSVKYKYDAINGLQSALQQGFIQASNEDFKFTHDRYSQAAMMLASPEKQDIIHLRIVQHFLSEHSVDKFWLADHVKAAIHLIQEKPIKQPFRRILLQAGDKAFDSGAQKLAFGYYLAAHELLAVTEDPWKDGIDTRYSETLHIYTRLAELSWSMDYDLTKTYLFAILEHAQSAIDRAAAYRVQHRYRWSHVGIEGSAPILLQCLRELGITDVQINRPDDELEKIYNEARTGLLQLGVQNIIKLPTCDNRLVKTRLSILEELCFWAYWTTDMKAMLCVGSRFILKTLKYGITPTSGVGFVFFGIAAVQRFKAYEFGEQIGEVGVELCDRYGGNAESARARYLYAAFLSAWKHPYHKSIPMARQAMKQGLLGGDRFYATFAHIYVVSASLFTGQNMAEVLRDAKSCLEEANSLGQTVGASNTATALVRVVMALQGKTKLTKDIFDSDDFQESTFIQEVKEMHANSIVQLYFFQSMKSVVLAYFGLFEESMEVSSKYKQFALNVPAARHTHLLIFFRCISIIRLVRANALDTKFLDELEENKAILQEWAQYSYHDNIQLYITCINAEMAWLNQNHMEAQKLYDLAIRQAKQGKWSMEAALMYEYAGDYFEQQGMVFIASTLFEKSMSTYRHMGIYGKANHLLQKYKKELSESKKLSVSTKEASVQTENMPTLVKRDSLGDLVMSDSTDLLDNLDSSTNGMNFSPEATLLTLDVVDLASILKSSQVISSEMNFELLMKQMLGIILENSGAESGVIIVKENTSFLIVGCGSQTDGCEIYNTPKLLSDEADSIIKRISQYAIHAQESLFIVDVQQDSRFSDYTTSSKSCICTPIIHKSAIVGCIYIEGAVGSLTNRHEVVLRLLSQQIGISLTNALLFKSIQKVTYENVKMIESQKAALEEARKSKEAALHAMRLKADFLANMSHELRTPFSGFYGMISLLSETALDAEQQDIVSTAKESCEMLLKIIDDLLNFSKLEAGKVSLDLGPLDVEEVIADTIEMLSSLAARKGLELAYIVDPDVPSSIIADSSRLRQILTNLVGNAIKFTHRGGVLIKCHLVKEDMGEEYIRLKIEVIDTGIGISPEQQRQLFEPFSQVDGSTTRMYGGTGLGLSICLQLVRLMLGNISLQSEPDKGSNFWFTIVANRVKAQENSNIMTAALRMALKNQTILLATESELNARMIRSLLSEFTTTHTSDMSQAVPKALQEHHPVLVLDIPPKPTTTMAHQLQSVDDDPECELHIILLYTPSTDGHKLAAEATNAASDRRGRLVKMAKPVRRKKLLHMLEQVLDQQQPILSRAPLGNRIKDYFEKNELDWYAKKPVLIAEDNIVAQKLLKKQLEKMGFVVESANNGEEAVKLWRDRPMNYYCMGFFDHHMPKCDGVEATKRIRAYEEGTNSRLPIIALTADIQSSARAMCIEAGMDGYLTKPLIPRDLAATLRKLHTAIQKHYNTPISSIPGSPQK